MTASLELQRQSEIIPVILEADNCIGGISRTINYKGNRIDIGGHRFFSKSDWVMNWWKTILPVNSADTNLENNECFLIRNRLSRIYFLRKYFDYPLKFSMNTLSNLGLTRTTRIGISYMLSQIMPIRKEHTLESFFINRFGRELYLTFFKDYTEKVWGISCNKISDEWGAQRIKGLSIQSALIHALKKLLGIQEDVEQKSVNTSLIERFLYPKYGPGQLWERVANMVTSKGGILHLSHRVIEVNIEDNTVASVVTENIATGEKRSFKGDYVISSMPVKELILAMGDVVPSKIRQIAIDLPYRDFITVGLLVKKMNPNSQSHSQHNNNMLPDNWVYIQERDVKVGRLQVFNNWSPGMVKDPETIWLGLEYFCNEGDELWCLSDEEMKNFAIKEMITINMIDSEDVIDSVVIKIPKAYPAYFGSYGQFGKIREFLDTIQNLFLIGRNGMHRYNNQDHSMLTAKLAVEHIISNNNDKSELWNVNIDDEYHEEK